MRRLIAFDCEGETLVGTCDAADGQTGLLIVSGGSEIRSGAHRGMALLAQNLASRGAPVFRYDRRGIGDSTGADRGFLSAKPDLIAAAAAFRATVPHVTRIVGFGNCDAASALALFGKAAALDGVVLANPWIIDEPDDLPPAAAIVARYRERLIDPGAWVGLASGRVNLLLVLKGLRKLLKNRTQVAGAIQTGVFEGIDRWHAQATVLIAERDATGRAFAAAAGPARKHVAFDTASHSFAGAENAARLEAEILAALERIDSRP